MNIKKRLQKLEAMTQPKPDLSKFTDEELRFIADIQTRMEENDRKFYHEVCTPEEVDRLKILSSKASLLWYRERHSRGEG